jgi:hypothetical protein
MDGDTGVQDTPPSSFLSEHRLGLSIAAALAGVLIVAFGVWLLRDVDTASSTPSGAEQPAEPASETSVPAAPSTTAEADSEGSGSAPPAADEAPSDADPFPEDPCRGPPPPGADCEDPPLEGPSQRPPDGG